MNKKSLKEYRIWRAMKARCYAPCYKDSYYQKDGIKVCEQWKNNFEQFLKDMGNIPGENYSIERIDVHKDYCPENCKWIPMVEQPINRRTTLYYTYNGKTLSLKEWSREVGIKYDTLRARVVRRHIPFEIAIKNENFDTTVLLNGERHTVTEWCKIKNLNAGIIFSRINRGWSKVKALTTPIKHTKYDIVQHILKDM